MKKFAVVAVVFALSAIGAANASASTFTASATGSITGKALETQEFNINAGTVRCGVAESTGTILSVASEHQHVHVTYKNCTAFSGFVPVHNITATYSFTSNGTVTIEEEIVIVVTTGFGTSCTVKVPKQTVKSVTYTNSGSNMIVTPNVSGIKYTTSGGLCGSGGENGTYKGKNEVSRVGGGSISWDA